MNYENQDHEVEDERKRDSSRKRDGKKEKKEKKYARFEEEDSEDEQLALAEELKSPSKNKKERTKPSFKFPVRKEKTKEKDEKKEKESKKEEKEKRREEKEGKKTKKDKKKSKHAQAPTIVAPSQCESPVFGVPLSVAVERNKSHDGIEIPAVVRECIDYIEECGLSCEGIYRISGVKSKVQHLKDAYNRQEEVYLYEHEPNVVASLLKQFLREIPEPVLTTHLMGKFEEASVIKNNPKKVEAFYRLVCDLPTCNRLLLSWMIVHMNHVILLATDNKMSLQNVSIVLSPTMQISHRVLYVLFSNVDDLFGNVVLRKYVPPLKPAHSRWSLELPDNVSCLEEELAKQESLLHQLHVDLNSGLTDPVKEEQLWEVQRVVTQLKRKIKTAKKNVEMGERRKATLDSKRASNSSLPSLSAPEDLQLDLRPAPPAAPKAKTVTAVVEREPPDTTESYRDQRKQENDQTDANKEEKSQIKVSSEDITNAKEELESQIQEKLLGKEGSDITELKNMIQEESSPLSEARETTSEGVPDHSNQCLDKESSTHHTEKGKVLGDPAERLTNDEAVKSVQSDQLDTKENVNMSVKEQDVVQAPVPSVLRKDVSSLPKARPPSIDISRKTTDTSKVTSPTLVKEVTLPQKTVRLPDSHRSPRAMAVKKKVEIRLPKDTVPAPAHLPPFMSTTLLQPMKADPPRVPSPGPSQAEKQEKQLRWEKLRELEEELLGERKKKVSSDRDASTEIDEITDDRPLEDILEEEYALLMEEEELLAIADELKQKMATEQSEMERLTQEIQELQYLRQDSDLEDLSSASEDSEDSEDEDDLHDLLTSLIEDNQGLEMKNGDMCQKIHEERMICLSVKLQIRLLQQKQMEEGGR